MKVSNVCDLCGLSAGRHPVTTRTADGKSLSFCCTGCRQVYIMLLEMSDSPDPKAFRETPLYRKCLELGLVPRTEEEAARFRRKPSNWITPEDPITEDGSALSFSEDLLSLQLKISGMWCQACAWYIETVLLKLPGIKTACCNFSTDRLTLQYDPVKTSPREIVQAISKLGYEAVLPGEDNRQTENRREFIRLILSALFTMNVMMLSFSLYSGFFISLPQDATAKISWPIFIMATIVIFYGGRPVIQKAIAGLTSFSFGMETLVCAGAFSAYFYSVAQLFFHSIHLYFDTASMLVTLVLLGKALERKAKARINETLDLFLSVVPTKVRLLNDLYPRGKYVSIEKLGKGDMFGVSAGEILPADGIVLDGTGRVDESLLTGEAKYVKKGPGDRIMSGSSVVNGDFEICAEATGDNSVLGQMAGIMASAMEQKSAIEAPTEKILQWFVPMVMLLAVGTGLYWSWAGLSTETAFMRAISVMVISCPCALGIAIPLARVAGVSASAKRGILVRNFTAFEKAPKLDTIVYDKTGTVTKGDWELLNVVCFGKMTREHALLLAGALEEESDHVVAAIIRENAGVDEDSALIDVEHIRYHAQGVSGILEGKEICIGTKRFVTKHIRKSDTPILNSRFPDNGLSSTVWMSVDNEICAGFLFGDAIKARAAAWVQTLKQMGLKLYLVSGDDETATRTVAEKIGIDCFYGGLTPVEKARLITRLQRNGHVAAMVGDGINDAPAMAEADVAVGIHGKNPLAKETADITLMRGDPGQLLEFFSLFPAGGKKNKTELPFFVFI